MLSSGQLRLGLRARLRAAVSPGPRSCGRAQPSSGWLQITTAKRAKNEAERARTDPAGAGPPDSEEELQLDEDEMLRIQGRGIWLDPDLQHLGLDTDDDQLCVPRQDSSLRQV